MAENTVYLTRERLREIQAELHEMKTEGRRENARMIAEARAHGDLSENSEYDAAKNRQQLHEYRVMQLERTLMAAQVIDESMLPTDKVVILSRVVVHNITTGSEHAYVLVSPEEADFDLGKISVTSPIGKALLGKSAHDVVDVRVPAGTMQLKIIRIGVA